MEGWIKIHRSIDEWEWRTDLPTFSVYLYILTHANIEDTKWKGHELKRGSLITSREHLAMGAGVSVMQVRSALKHLENTGEITLKSTNKFTQIYVNKWDKFQSMDENVTNKQPTNNQQITNKQPTNNQQITTDKEYKNIRSKEYKNKRNINSVEILKYLNAKAGKNFHLDTSSNLKNINARFKDGYTEDELKMVIDLKVMQWADSEKMREYLRPATLFSEKFDSYLQEAKLKLNESINFSNPIVKGEDAVNLAERKAKGQALREKLIKNMKGE